MAVAQGPFLAAVLLLVSSGLHCSSSIPVCPEPCTCQRAPLLNCSSSGLSLVPQPIQDFVTELDLSHNHLDSVTLDRPHHNLRNVWLGNNTITRLSLCIEGNLGGRHVRGRHLHHLRPWSRRGCVSWAPTLQLLSVERNQLEQLPEGLEGSQSLQVLQLSFNRISTLRPADLGHLRQLVELHLQHNLITSLHPQMFQHLTQLQVLDLSFNKLTSLHPLIYPSLHYIGVDVRLGGNRWQCDCSMRNLKRRMALDSSRGLQTWSVVCASPSILSGRDLLQVEEEDLNCFSAENRPELHQDVTVYSGSEILLSCTQDSMWWMSGGQGSVSQHQAGLRIDDITERDTGLYVCVSEEHEVMSVFNLQIIKTGGARRKTRSLPRTSQQMIPQGTPNRIGEERTQGATQSQLALAVCLSILFTFLIAFVLGVLARPCIDVLCRRVTKKRRTETEANHVSSVEQREYDNEAYSSVEEPEERPEGSTRERRVTFSTDDRENTNVQYYDTVASGDQESINSDVVIECEAAKAERDTNTAGDSGSENSLQQSSSEENQRAGRNLSGRKDNIEFEHIPDPVELEKRRSSSSSSDSSLSDKVFNEDRMTQRDHTTLKSPLTEESVQQRADFEAARKVVVPQISIEGSEIPEFTSEPFAEWSPHRKDPDLTHPDLWQENEELFEFSDRSMSARSSSVRGSFNDSKLIVVPTADKQKRNTSSSSSSVSEDEITEYTVNSDHEEEEDIERNHNKPDVTNAYLKQHAGFQQQMHGVDPIMPSVGFNQGDYRYDTEGHAVRPKHSSSSHSSDGDGQNYTINQEKYKGQGKDKSIDVSDKLSSKTVTGKGDTRKKVEPMPRTKWPVPNLVIKSQGMSLDTRASSPPSAYSSSSSSESEADIADLKVEQNTSRVNEGIKINQPETLSTDLDRQRLPKIKRRSDISAPSSASDSTSSDESADETTKHIKRQEKGDVGMAGLPTKENQSLSYDAMKPQWLSQNLAHATPIKSHMDIRAPSPPTVSSSSSESADETMDWKQTQKEMHLTRPISHDSDKRWPALDLEQTTHTSRRLNIKAPSPPPDSSSSSNSEDETTGQTEKQEQGQGHMARLPIKVSQTVSHDPQTQWPLIDLGHTIQVKRRQDIKVPSQASESSSSSDSEDKTTHDTERPGKVGIAGRPFQESQAKHHDPETRWPALDLEHTTRIKKRLDIKAPSPASDSSSSSDSEGETTHHIKKQEQGKTDMARLPITASQTLSHNPKTQWPLVDLGHTIEVKRRLDIKAPSPASDSSSSSDSEDETKDHTKEERPELVGIAGRPFQESQTKNHDPETRWPAVDLGNITRIKRRLDIKAPSPASDSSSSSDSEDETTHHIKKQEQGRTDMARLPITASQTLSHNPKTQWPLVDLGHTIQVNRCLDIKAPSPASDSSSSSDSEDETTHHTKEERPELVGIAGRPFQESQTKSHDPETRWPAVDLGNITRIKRHLDIKAPLPGSDSSSSSDSEDETTHHIKKQEQGKTDMARLPITVSQTPSDVSQTQWPALNLEHTTRIKRRLDIKAPKPDANSSSSSDSEDETTGHLKKQRPGKVGTAGLQFQESQTKRHDPEIQWPALDLEHTTRIKRRLDIKAPSPASDSSSSSDSEDETTHHIKKQEQRKTDMARLPTTVSQSLSHDPQIQWPLVDLGHTIQVKRHLDIKAPSPASDSSSSSDSEDETKHHTKKERPELVGIAGRPFQESQTKNHDPETRWPLVDLGNITRIKRRLDIKAPSPASDSSSSSDSEDETTHQTKKDRPEQMGIAGHPLQESQTKNHDPETRWPLVDLGNITRIKRSLDIKAPSPASDSSSSSDSEDETTHQTKKKRPEQMGIAGHPLQESQTKNHDPETRWPLVDLGNITRIKRRLDIKAPLPGSDSSSSSDSEDETTHHIKKQEQGKTDMARLPITVSQTPSDVSQTQWPALNLEHTTRIKRRLDIKAPKPDANSSSSSDSEDETTGHLKKQRPGKVGTAGLQFQESQTKRHDPEIQWPALDLEHTTRIKRRLDIKAPSPASDSSSSSDSEDETTHHIKKQEQRKTDMARLPTTVSQSLSHDPQIQWPLVDLGHTIQVKRHLDIKAPSPASDSSSSSDSEDETKHHTKKERPELVGIAGRPFQESQTKNHDPETRWPLVDLGNITRIKRRLDIKAPSPASDSSSSSDSEDETTHQTKKDRPEQMGIAGHPLQESQTKNHDPETRWPLVDLGNITRIKRRLDIKAPSPASDSSSSSDSEDETTHQTKKKRPEQMGIAGNPLQESQTKSHNSETRWPAVDLGNITRIKRRLDIKAPSPASDSSSSSDSEDETTHHIKKQEQGKTDMARLPITVSQTPSDVPQTQWPSLNLEHTTRIKRRLDIKAPSPDSNSSSSSDSEDETTGHLEKQRPGKVGTAGLQFQESQTEGSSTRWPALDLDHTEHIKRRLDIKAPSPASSSSSDSEDETTCHAKESPKLVEIAGLMFQKSQTVSHDPETRWPAVDLDSILSCGSINHTVEGKRPEAREISPCSSSSSSDEQGEGMEDLNNPPTTVEPDPDSRWPQLGLSSALHVKRRLDIKAPSPQPDLILSSVSPGSQQSKSNSSSSDSEDENRDHAKLGASAIKTKEKLIRSPKTTLIHTSHSPSTDHNIKLEKYTIITDDMGDKTTRDNIMTTPVINPELESRWATMNLGISRFRKRLEITSHTPPKPPNPSSSPPPDSSSPSISEMETGSKSSRTIQKRKGDAMPDSSGSSENKDTSPENAGKGWTGRSQVYVVTDKEASQIHTSLYVEQTSKVGDESDSVQPQMSRTNISKTRRALDIKREASSSSSSENETMDHDVPGLSLGVPCVKMNLNVKAPLPGSSSSSSSDSESENEATGDAAKQSKHASDMSGLTDDSIITYKRVIFKPSLSTIDYTNRRHTGAETVTVAHQSPSYGVGGSNTSLAPRRVPSMSFDDVVKKRIEESKHTTDVDVPPEIRWTGIGHQLSDLSVSSPGRQLEVGLLTPQQAPPSGSLTSIRALDKFDNSPRSTYEILGAVPHDRRERKGLSALKAMSSERQTWDTQDENLATDFLDGIPHYRRHDNGGIEPLQKAPPPIPATPPSETGGLTWRSAQSSNKQGSEGTRSDLQRESDPPSITSQNLSDYFESSNISYV